jgi:glucose/arabinose dehydrogenase
VTIGVDERIYVAIGAPCDFCEVDDPARGSIWSYKLDGSDGQQVASGLRQPSDVAFRKDVLWTLDTARDGLTGGNLDELNRVDSGAHFGWPYCVGQENEHDLQGDFDCGQATAPALTLPTHSNPIGLAVYDHTTFPKIEGDLLVVLRGNDNQSYLEGYALAAIQFDENGKPSGYRLIIPERTATSTDPIRLRLDLQQIQYGGSGFWPRHPIDVAVSPEGWIYVSLGGGSIFALRPL